MKCSLCNLEFDEKQANQECKGCMLAGSCKKIRCPHCGYEAPVEPDFIKKIKERFKKTK
jgi:rubredoxin